MSWIYLLHRRSLSRVEELKRRDRHHSVFESRTFRGFFNRLVVSRIEETVFVPFLKLNVVLDQLFRTIVEWDGVPLRGVRAVNLL